MTTYLTLGLLMLGTGDMLGSGDHRRELMVDERERNYLVHIPKLAQSPAKWPVVLVYHGGGSNSEIMIRFCGMNDKADEAGFVAVYPSGTGRFPRALTYNGGNCCGRAVVGKVDDVKFTRAVLDDLERTVSAILPKKKNDPIAEGVKLIHSQMKRLLENHGIEEIGTIGSQFDVDLHEALMVVKDDHYASNAVVEVHLKGYKLNDRVLRHAKVAVNQ